jgi:hypothetical protein
MATPVVNVLKCERKATASARVESPNARAAGRRGRERPDQTRHGDAEHALAENVGQVGIAQRFDGRTGKRPEAGGHERYTRIGPEA